MQKKHSEYYYDRLDRLLVIIIIEYWKKNSSESQYGVSRGDFRGVDSTLSPIFDRIFIDEKEIFLFPETPFSTREKSIVQIANIQ